MPKINEVGWKGVQIGYDEILLSPVSVRKCSYCLQDNEIEAILGMLTPLGWATRWYSVSGVTIDSDLVDAFASDLREKLMSGCCDDGTTIILQRINSETGILQVSTNGGETWQDSGSDPRIGGVAYPPPVTSGVSSDICDASTNVVNRFIGIVVQLEGDKEANRSNSEIGAGLAVTLATIFGGGFVGAVTAIFAGVIVLLISKDATDIAAAFSTTTWDEFLCAVYCSIKSDGSFDDSAVATLKSKVSSGVTSAYARDCLLGLIDGMKAIGLTNCAAQGSSSGADCSACDPCDACTDISSWIATTPGTTGTVTDTQPGYIEVAADFYSGFAAYVAEISTEEDNTCCTLDSIETVSGSWNSGAGQWYRLCGEVWSGTAHNGDAAGLSINHIWVIGSVPFTVRYHFTP